MSATSARIRVSVLARTGGAVMTTKSALSRNTLSIARKPGG
jgi:hypothetical protein